MTAAAPVPRAAVFSCPGRPRPLARRLAIHNRVLRRLRDHFEIEGYNEIPVSALAPVGSACEAVDTAVAVDHCGHLAFVRQSAQLTLDGMIARGFPAVWCESESVRREWKRDERHLTGFKLIEATRRDLDLDGLCGLMSQLLRYVAGGLGADLLGGRHITRLHRLTRMEIPRLTYREALAVLNGRGWSMPFGEDLHRDAEATLTRYAGHVPLIVTHLPAELKPFNLKRAPGDDAVTLSAELILPWAGETADGGVYETDAGAMRERLQGGSMYHQLLQRAATFAAQRETAAGSGAATDHQAAVRHAFDEYLAPFAQTPLPRAGFALGFARLLQYLQGLDSIRDAVIQPQDRNSFGRTAAAIDDEADAAGGSGDRLMDAFIALETGRVFRGRLIGANTGAGGEMVFHTGMTGYQEILTDPSYAGQVIVFTASHIGNYGIHDTDHESEQVHPAAVVVRDFCRRTFHRGRETSLDVILRRAGVPAITGVDTRALTAIIRDEGNVRAWLGTGDPEELVARARALPAIGDVDWVAGVTCAAPWDFAAAAATEAPFRVSVLDCGVKRSILHRLSLVGCQPRVYPASTSAATLLADEPEGVFLSNGPGDPAGLPHLVATVRELLKADVPLFGICLGHQLLARALGAETVKLPFGHHGANHPVRNLATGRVEITSQNHNYAVPAASIDPVVARVTHQSLNDDSVEGMEALAHEAYSVQYHPEAAPGPSDSLYLFDRFRSTMLARRTASEGRRHAAQG